MLYPRTWPAIRADWAWIRAGLQTIIDRTGERWLPEDVYMALHGGHAHLSVIEESGEEVGFVVLQRQSDWDGPVLHVWALWGEPGAIAPLRLDIERELVELATRMGARRIKMESPREGWTDIAFWKPSKSIYVHEVQS